MPILFVQCHHEFRILFTVLLALLIDVLSVMLDIIVLSTYFPNTNSGHTEKFSAVIAIFNLIFRYEPVPLL